MTEKSLFEEGRNCWRKTTASRLAPLVDANEYFTALAWAAERAKHSIFILGWDIDTRISLITKAEANPETEPATLPLSQFLLSLVEKQSNLKIIILMWDFVWIYAHERERKRRTRVEFASHPRIHFSFLQGSTSYLARHQKVVVIDGQLAFCGGLDLTQRRWDTPRHKIRNFLRRDPDGKSYEPFHDVQIMVSGPAAKSLEELCYDNWNRFGPIDRPYLTPPTPKESVEWPPFVPPLFEQIPVAISRTLPEIGGLAPVRENEQLFYDSIRSAEKLIFIENQYFTSDRIGDALIEKLQSPSPPEIIILVRLKSSSWMEALSVSVLRAKLLRRLRRHDRQGRLLVVCPFASVKKQICINLHSKVFIVDDRFLRIGSSNLCNRSLGMDTECDLSTEVFDPTAREKLERFRNRLLAEHLDIPEPEFSQQGNAPLIPLIRSFQRRRDRTLIDCPHNPSLLLEWLVPTGALVDPESPRQFRWALTRVVLYLVLLVLVLSHWSSIRSAFRRETLIAATHSIEQWPLSTPFLAILFGAITFLGFPLIPIAIIFAFVLPPLTTFLTCTVGALLGGLTVYVLAHKGARIRKLGLITRLLENDKILQVQALLKKQGVWPLIMLRLTPIAPFWLVNFCMGAMQIPPRNFLISLLVGILPGFIAIAWLDDKLSSYESLKNVILIAVAVVLLTAWAIQKAVRHLLERRETYANRGEL